MPGIHVKDFTVEMAWKVVRIDRSEDVGGDDIDLEGMLIEAVNKEGFPELDLPPGLVINIDPNGFLMFQGERIKNQEGRVVRLRLFEISDTQKSEVHGYFLYEHEFGDEYKYKEGDENEFGDECCPDKANLKEVILNFTQEKSKKLKVAQRESDVKEEGVVKADKAIGKRSSKDPETAQVNNNMQQIGEGFMNSRRTSSDWGPLIERAEKRVEKAGKGQEWPIGLRKAYGAPFMQNAQEEAKKAGKGNSKEPEVVQANNSQIDEPFRMLGVRIKSFERSDMQMGLNESIKELGKKMSFYSSLEFNQELYLTLNGQELRTPSGARIRAKVDLHPSTRVVVGERLANFYLQDSKGKNCSHEALEAILSSLMKGGRIAAKPEKPTEPETAQVNNNMRKIDGELVDLRGTMDLTSLLNSYNKKGGAKLDQVQSTEPMAASKAKE